MKTFKSFLADESGATATEYGLIIALVAVVITSVVKALGTSMAAKFEIIKDDIAAAQPAATN